MAQQDQPTWRGNERMDDWKARTSTEPRDREQRGRAPWIAAALVLLVVFFFLVVYMSAFRW